MHSGHFLVVGSATSPRLLRAMREFIGRTTKKYIAAATIKNELGMLGGMFTIVRRAGAVPSRSLFPTIKVNSSRGDFIEEDDL